MCNPGVFRVHPVFDLQLWVGRVCLSFQHDTFTGAAPVCGVSLLTCDVLGGSEGERFPTESSPHPIYLLVTLGVDPLRKSHC